MGKRGIVVRLGEEVPEPIAFDNNATVNDALSAFGALMEKSETLAIDGKTIEGNHVFSDGDVVYITPSTTGA